MQSAKIVEGSIEDLHEASNSTKINVTGCPIIDQKIRSPPSIGYLVWGLTVGVSEVHP